MQTRRKKTKEEIEKLKKRNQNKKDAREHIKNAPKVSNIIDAIMKPKKKEDDEEKNET